MYDKNGAHDMRDTTMHRHIFMHGGKQVTLHLMKPKTTKDKDQEHVLPRKHSKYTMSTEAM